METPIWKTPAFWRELAEEWRGPKTFATDEGICGQLVCALEGYKESSEAREFLQTFHRPYTRAYFWPITDEYRIQRADLCDKIADHLEHENQTQGPNAQT